METFTLSAIATAAGMAVVVTALVQITKYYLDKLSPKWLALAWSAILNLASFAWVGQDHSMQAAFSMVINILYVSAAANGVFQYAVKPAAAAISGSRSNDKEGL